MAMAVAAVCVGLGACGGGAGGATDSTAAASSTASAAAAAPTTNATAAPPTLARPTQATSGSSEASVAGILFSFTLPSAQTTSAGVYAGDGTLVRTLWRGQAMAAGLASASWDQRDDSGALVAPGAYQIKVAHHQMQYVWEGVIGNTSAQAGAAVLHKGYLEPTSLASAGGQMFYAVGYNEGQSGINGFALSNPQLNQSPVRLVDAFVAANMIATDGNRLYWVNAGGVAASSFVAAFDVASGAQSVFSAGTPVCLNLMADGQTCYAAQSYQSVLELRRNLASPPSGIAVQANGPVLAVAYGGDGAVRLYDKTSGQLLQVLPLQLNAGASNQIAMAPGGDLWVISGTGLQRYTNLATTPTLAATISGLAHPLAVTVDPQDDGTVWVADGGAHQQLERFDAQGRLQQTLGLAGGCNNQVQVSKQRLCFMTTPGQEQTTIAVDATHALWVMDSANNRMLQWSGGSVTAQIAYLPAVYAAATDTGNPTRVFANYLEFAVDYSKPLSDPASWTLVRNWLPTLPASLVDDNSANRTFGGFTTVLTMTNGRTYAMLNVSGQTVLVELTTAGVRAVRTWPAASGGQTAPVLYENGDLGDSVTDSTTQQVRRWPLQGFDSAGNPVWAASPTVLASAPVGPATPAYTPYTFAGLVGARFPLTASGEVVFFNPSVEADTGFHLGAINQGASAWAWQASPSAALDGLGSFQTRKVDSGIQYGGNTVFALGRSIVYGFHGEYYTDLGNGRFGEANQFMHFLDDGLFVGEFGVASTRATSPSQPGLSGNAFSPTLVRQGGKTYLYHNDESAQGGVHRWRLDGIDDIQELVGSGSTGSTIVLQ
jgi:hypothetical protein